MSLKWYATATRAQWLALAAALLGWFFDGFEMGIFPLVARPALVEVLHLTDVAVRAKTATDRDELEQLNKEINVTVGPWMGRITAAFLVGAALGGWFFGWVGDRVGRVRGMVFSVLTYALFTGLCGLARAPLETAGLRFLAALGMGGEWALGVALVMESWPEKARPWLAGLIGAVANLGYLLCAFLVEGTEALGVAMDAGGWRWVLGACAFPALLTFLLRLFVPESEKWKHAAQSGPRAKLADIFTPVLLRRTLVGTALSGIALIGTWGSVQWIPLWTLTMTNRQSLANEAQKAMSVGAAVGAFLGAVAGQYFGRRVVYIVLCIASLISCAYLFRWHLMLVGGSIDASFFAVVFVTGGVTASFYGWLPLYLPELFPTRVRATGQGFGFNFGRIIAAVGALNTGILIGENGLFHGAYDKAAATMSLVYVLGMIAIWFAPETHGKPLPD
jgi:MFS transporter, SHS family, sialic acid transporter